MNPRADQATIRSAYRTLMFKSRCHPDLGGDEEHAREINEAYEVLHDPSKRQEYNFKLGPEFFSFKQTNDDVVNRRRVPRVYVDLPASFKRERGTFEPARVVDISTLGCRIQTTEKLDKGTGVSVNISGHIIEGTIRWNRMFHPSIFQRIHEAGVEFAKEFEDIDRI